LAWEESVQGTCGVAPNRAQTWGMNGKNDMIRMMDMNGNDMI